eukprot:NODE_4503_length_799_cov_54.492000_g4164_i0.p1 GENE.NODE_4503_length_799_cov_54.492000_g4164_i0~~NODE_4503_length_799_cov_54.492000_g4164_i0.p1  ORF type:complete len:252 (-),score=47.89 NODE_4503_length_799_cov_54.492000_g4164_i0:44-706(-)
MAARGADFAQLNAADVARLRLPKSVYGLSKLLDEMMMRKFEVAHELRWTSLRYGNVCGADPEGVLGEAKRRPHTLMTLAIYSLLDRTPKLKLFGTDYPTPDGTTVRDYVHPADLAQGHVAALQRLLSGAGADVFNLGTGRGSSVLDVIKAVEEASGKTVDYDVHPRRLGDCVLSALSTAKAEQTLGYRPRFDLSAMAATAWRWHTEFHDPNSYRRANTAV